LLKEFIGAEVKSFELDVISEWGSEPEKWRQIIDAEPNATIGSTTKVHPDELDEREEGECLFHLKVRVKGTSMHFIIDSGS